jgi:putative intracellular protease/amidase
VGGSVGGLAGWRTARHEVHDLDQPTQEIEALYRLYRLRNAGAEWEDAEVVVDGHLVSSRNPDDLPAFLPAMIEVAAHAPTPA